MSARDVSRGEVELGEHVFHRNTLPTASPEPSAALKNAAAILFG
jgi:hypothetical protein